MRSDFLHKKEAVTDDELKKIIFEKDTNVKFQVRQGTVVIVREQMHPIQKFFRKLHFKIPKKTYLELDEYGSFVYQMVDGQHSVYDIGQALGKKYDEANEYLYSRLLIYLNHIEKNEHLIKRKF